MPMTTGWFRLNPIDCVERIAGDARDQVAGVQTPPTQLLKDPHGKPAPHGLPSAIGPQTPQ
jgi:hypothetical protein